MLSLTSAASSRICYRNCYRVRSVSVVRACEDRLNEWPASQSSKGVRRARWGDKQGAARNSPLQLPAQWPLGLVVAERPRADRVLEVPRERRMLLPDPLDALADAAGDGLAGPVARVRGFARPAPETVGGRQLRVGTRPPRGASQRGPCRPTGWLPQAR